jgi:hypothetical protein
MSFNLTIAWKASPMRTPPPICAPAPLLRTALARRTVGVANDVRDTTWLVSRNGNDSRRLPSKSTRRWQNQAAAFAQGSKVLNLRTDSKCRSAVIFLTIAQNKFINCLRWSGAAMHFQTTDHRYADK